MDRPRIICHILQSVDGNIDGDFFTVPEIGSAYRAFSRIREEFACDAVVSGATTAAEIYRGGFIGILPQASERWPRTDRKAASAEKYAVVIDGTGSVRWDSGSVERKGCFAFGKASRFATGDGSILRIEARHRAKHKCTERRDIPGSTAFVPAVAGLMIAAEVIRDLTRDCPREA